MHDRQRPGEGSEQQAAIAEENLAVQPLRQRVEQHRDAAEPDHHADEALRPDTLARQGCERHDPQAGGIGQHRRAAGRDEAQPEIRQREEAGDLKNADRQDDRQIRPARQAPPAERQDQRERCRGAEPGPRRGEPDRRRAALQPDLHDRPGDAEQGDDHGKLAEGLPVSGTPVGRINSERGHYEPS